LEKEDVADNSPSPAPIKEEDEMENLFDMQLRSSKGKGKSTKE